MKRISIVLLSLLCFLFALSFNATPSAVAEDVQEAIEAIKKGIDLEKNSEIILNSVITAKDLYNKLIEPPKYEPAEAGWKTGDVEIEPGYSLKYACNVPEGYEPGKSYPLVIMLHGGVSRPQPLPPDVLQKYSGMYTQLVDEAKEPYFIIVPQGTAKATWWSRNGLKMVTESIKQVRLKYNIDSNRVLVTGFSDGASGCYYLSAVSPTQFSSFWPFNGLVAVAAIKGEKIYLHSMKNRPIFACNTTNDSLYPPQAYNPFIEAMKKCGIDITFTEFEKIGHRPDYFPKISSDTAKWFKEKKRNPWPDKVCYATADLALPRCDWIEITKLGSTHSSTEFTQETVKMKGRVMVGVTIDNKYEGEGVRVAEVSDGSSAEEAGIQDGDIIIEFNGEEITSLADLQAAIRKLKEGDEYTVVIERNGNRKNLTGEIGPVQGREFFNYKEPGGFITVEKEGNTFNIKTQFVRRFVISVRPGFIFPDKTIELNINGDVFEGEVSITKVVILQAWRRDLDRELLPSGIIEITVD